MTEDTPVTKQQAMVAISQAFQGKAANARVPIRDIVLASAKSNDTWKTSNHAMNEHWTRPPSVAGGRPSACPSAIGGYPSTASPVEVPTAPQPHSNINWMKAIDSGSISKAARMGKIRKMFDALDDDDDHVVTRAEFVAAMKQHGMHASDAESLFREMDDSRSGRLTVAKFDHYVAMYTLNMVKETFKGIDTSSDKQISKQEFKMFFMDHGLSAAQATALWDSMDSNKNGKINFVEYRNWALEAFTSDSLDRVALELGLL